MEVFMMRDRIWHGMRMAALAATLCLAFGSVAWGQEWRMFNDDDYYKRHDEAREHGYQNGYRDGLRGGQSDSDRGRRFKFRNDDWEDSRGYEHWMGNHGHYKQAYRQGYERGYRRAYGYYAGRRGWDRDSYRDRDDYRWRDRDDWR
jgi:hypothetical protein